MPFDNPPQPRREIILLRAAKERISYPERWAKNCWIDSARVCAMQAVKIVSVRRSMRRHLSRILARELPTRYRVWFFVPAQTKLVFFNDRKSTSHQMVMELFDSAITRLELEPI